MSQSGDEIMATNIYADPFFCPSILRKWFIKKANRARTRQTLQEFVEEQEQEWSGYCELFGVQVKYPYTLADLRGWDAALSSPPSPSPSPASDGPCTSGSGSGGGGMDAGIPFNILVS